MNMSDKINLKQTFESNLTVTKKGETSLDAKAFSDALQVADVSEKQYKAVTELNSAIASGLTEALAEKTLPAFKANKDLESVSVKLPTVGRDFFEVSIDRQGKYRNPADGSEIVKYGIVNLEHNVLGTRKGEFGAVKKAIAAQWTEALKK